VAVLITPGLLDALATFSTGTWRLLCGLVRG